MNRINLFNILWASKLAGGGGGGVDAYINGVKLQGQKKAEDLKLSYDVAGQIDYWHTEHDSTDKRYFYNALKDVLVTTGSAYASLVETVFNGATGERDILIPYKNGEVLTLISADTTADDIFVGFNYQKGTKVRAFKETVSGSEYYRIEETAIGTGESKPYLSLNRLGAYIYEVSFDTIPDSKDLDNAFIGGCSSFVKDGKLYRNLDWKYDNTAEFRVKTKTFEGMSFINGMNDGELDDEKIGQLPYSINDGVNNDGIRVSSHVLYNDWTYAGAGSKNKLLTQLPYYILSNLHSMSDISTVLSDYLANIKVNDSLVSAEYLMQFVVTDGTTTYAILPPESATGSYVLVDITANPKMTNFRWVADKTVVRTALQNRPTGVERFNEIDNLTDGLEGLRFTKCYEEPTRLSEFIGEGGTTKDSTDAQLTALYNTAHAKYLTRSRNGELWQTCHSIVYGAKGMESLCVQEDWTKDYVVQGGGGVDIDPAVLRAEIEKVLDNTKIDFIDIKGGQTDYVVGYKDADNNDVVFPIYKNINPKNFYTPSELGLTPVTKATLDGTEEYVEVPSSVTSITATMFAGFTALKEVVMHNVTSIQADSFADCEALENYMIWNTTPPTYVADMLRFNDGTILWCDEGFLAVYKTAYPVYANSIKERHHRITRDGWLRVFTDESTIQLDYNKQVEVLSAKTSLTLTFTNPSSTKVSEYRIIFTSDSTADFGLTVTPPANYTLVGVPTIAKGKTYEISFNAQGSNLVCISKEY